VTSGVASNGTDTSGQRGGGFAGRLVSEGREWDRETCQLNTRGCLLVSWSSNNGGSRSSQGNLFFFLENIIPPAIMRDFREKRMPATLKDCVDARIVAADQNMDGNLVHAFRKSLEL
jgi:hypothetical protein